MSLERISIGGNLCNPFSRRAVAGSDMPPGHKLLVDNHDAKPIELSKEADLYWQYVYLLLVNNRLQYYTNN